MGKIKLKLWDDVEHEFTSGVPIVLLGANGSGKTRLGVRIEAENGKKDLLVHRLAAQKSLELSETMQIKAETVSKNELHYGHHGADGKDFNAKKIYGHKKNESTGLLHDYDKVLSLLFSSSSAELEKQHRKGEAKGYKTLVMRAEEIWNDLLPKRKIDLRGGEVYVIADKKYHGKHMSDGERVILYMIAQVLTLRENSVLIIDEPELHIHKAILNKLWNKLERARRDCLFIYITHDLDFAVSRNTQKAVWIKAYDGTKTWDAEFLDYLDFEKLPTELIYEIIGTQKKIIFVEGTKSSLDFHLYQELYREFDYHVIPCGGCQDVIRFVKAKRGYEKLDNITVYGVIDRDYRTESEIESHKKHGIYCLEVAEVENLFVVPKLLEVMERQLGCDDGCANRAKQFIFDLYKKQVPKQIGDAFRKEMNFQLSHHFFADIEPTAVAMANEISKAFSYDKVKVIFDEITDKYNSADSDDLNEVLKVFNFKELSKSIGSCYNISRSNTSFTARVLNLLKSGKKELHDEIIDAIRPYVPTLPQ